jgi:arginine utilization regulatory protein
MSTAEPSLLSAIDYLEILRNLDEGVVITDAEGRVLFLNEAQARLDGVDHEDTVGKMLAEVWEVDEADSVTLRCLRTRLPVVNEYLAYRTRTGRIVSTIHSVFPLGTGSGLAGSISFVRGYNLLEETITSICSVVEKTRPRTWSNGTRYRFQDLVGESPALLDCIRTAKLAALTDSSVMILGATGTGKELFAQSIHNYGPRKEQPYIGLNCAAIPENLLEGLLFGTVRGAFTGATDKPGLFEKADGGTLYLDEVNAMALGLQAKLLRVLQERRVRRVGSFQEREIDVKLLSSVNEDPGEAIAGRRLRMDLYYRLAVVMVQLPALAERRGDIPVLTRFFLDKFNRAFGRQVLGVSGAVAGLFQAYPWPGNVRELEHALEASMNVVGERPRIGLDHLPPYLAGAPRAWDPAHSGPTGPVPERDAAPGALGAPGRPGPGGDRRAGPEPRNLPALQAEVEQEAIARALAETQGSLGRAAGLLGVSRQRLAYRIRKSGLDRRDFRPGGGRTGG